MATIYDVLSSYSIIFVLLLCILFALRYLKSNSGLPGPHGWPVVGSLVDIDAESYLTFERWAKKYGDIFSVNFGLENVIILNSIDVVKCALRDQGDKFVDRPILPIVELGLTRQGGFVFENGHPWNERRRWAFSFIRDFCLGKSGRLKLETLLNIEAGYLCQEFGKQTDSFVPVHLINNAVSNIICTASFGDRFEYSDPKFKNLMQEIRYLFTNTTFTSPVNVLPVLFYTPMYNSVRRSVASVKAFIDGIIQEHEATFESNDIRDVIDSYIKESQKEGTDPELFSKDTLWRTIFDIFAGGTDTATSTILFIILYLVNYPDVQRKLQQEVDDILGQEKKPKWVDRISMPYLEATILEVQRLSNPAPLFARRTTDEVKIKGYKIPANTTVLINIHSIQRHDSYWGDPLEFKPERFLTEDLKTLKKQEAYIPFGLGRRVCIGELMARMEIFIFMANLMQRFTFRVPDDKPIPSVNDCISGLTISPKKFELIAIKR